MKPATLVTVILLVLVAVLHIVRLALGVQVTVQAFVVPMWASVIATIVPATLAVAVWREHRRPTV